MPRLTPLQWLICAIAALGFAFDIYEVLMAPLVVGPAIGELTGFKPGTPDFNFWVGMFFWVPALVGGAFGLLGGYLTDRFGRRRVLVWSILIYAFSAMAAGFATNIEVLLLLRSTTFIGVFVEFVAAVAWIAEIFEDPKQREAALGYTQAFSSVGGIMVTGAYALAVTYSQLLPEIAGGHAPWRYTLVSGVIPALPLILIRPFLPESPAWREKKAAGTLKRPDRRDLHARSCARRRSSRRSCSRAPTVPRSAPSSRCRASSRVCPRSGRCRRRNSSRRPLASRPSRKWAAWSGDSRLRSSRFTSCRAGR